MVILKEFKTIEDFDCLQKGDFVACEFNRLVHDYPKQPYSKGIFQVYEVKKNTKEVILQKKNNIYFNYEMYLEGTSNCSNIVKIDFE